jgi:hypothetical protein
MPLLRQIGVPESGALPELVLRLEPELAERGALAVVRELLDAG